MLKISASAVKYTLRIKGHTRGKSPSNLHEKVSRNVDHAQSRMKEMYDEKARPSNIGPGDWVLVRDESRSNTLAPLYLGPWLVAEKLGFNLDLIEPRSGRKKIVHLNRCELSPRNRELTTESDIPTCESENHSSMELDQVEIGVGDTESDVDNAEPRRSTRIRRDSDRFGEFQCYWQNKGNQSRPWRGR